MSYPVWPSDLPNPERAGYQATPQDARRQRRSDAGPVSFSRRFSSASTSVTMSIVVSRT